MYNKIIIISCLLVMFLQIPGYSATNTLTNCKPNVSLSDVGITAKQYVNLNATDRSRINALIQNLKTKNGNNCNTNVSLSDLGMNANDYLKMGPIERSRIDELLKILKNKNNSFNTSTSN